MDRKSWIGGAAAAFAAAAALLSACTEENDFIDRSSDNIRFNVSQVSRWITTTRSSAAPTTVSSINASQPADAPEGLSSAFADCAAETILTLTSPEDTLYLNQLYTTGRNLSADDLPSLATTDERTPDAAPGKSLAPGCNVSSVTGTSERIISSYKGSGESNGGEKILTKQKDFSDPSQVATKAAPIDENSFYSSIGVFSYIYSGSWSESLKPDYFYNFEAKATDDWTTSYRWPKGGRKLRFFAYAPFHCTGLTISSASTSGTPTLTYTVPANVADQNDILVAATAAAGLTSNPDTDGVPLQFEHILTAVNFVTGQTAAGKKITRIALKGIPSTAVHTIGGTSWSAPTNPQNFSQDLAVTVSGTPGQTVTSGEATFMMIPQTLPEGATLEITRTDPDGSGSETLSASMAGQVWPFGKSITYEISTTNSDLVYHPVFNVTPPQFTYAGGTVPYTVESYAIAKDRNGATVYESDGVTPKTIKLGWSAQFEDGNGVWTSTAPGWITGFTASGEGSSLAPGAASAAVSYNAVIAPQTVSTSGNPMAGIPSVGSASQPYDLSTCGGTTAQNTANCYIVNAPGTYSLPLVYGNAIKNGEANTSSYSSSTTGDNRLLGFLNHKGVAISNPYIYNNANCTPNGATIVWQDEENLVTNVALSSDNHSLTFTVAAGETFKQGNAVIAVQNGSTIMWSWHIWVTYYKPELDLFVEHKAIYTNATETTKMMSVNLGWCDTAPSVYAARNVKVRFTQAAVGEASAEPIILDFGSERHSEMGNLGNTVFYQWGRKDPIIGGLPATNNTSFIEKPRYQQYGSYTYPYRGTGAKSLQEWIYTPYQYSCNGDGSWNTSRYVNLWSMDNVVRSGSGGLETYSNVPVVKTVYDPSPVGYKIPNSKVFSGFTFNGLNLSNPGSNIEHDETINFSQTDKNVNSPYTSSSDFGTNKGWKFYCRMMTSKGESGLQVGGGTIFFPRNNIRGSSNTFANSYDDISYFWGAEAFSTTYGSALRLAAGSVTPYSNYINRMGWGFAVRAVRDESVAVTASWAEPANAAAFTTAGN